MRTVLITLLALLPAQAVAALQRAPRPKIEWQEAESDHYHLFASGDLEKSKALLDRLELVYKTYCDLLNYDEGKKLDKKFTVKLYKDRAQFVADGAPPGAGAYYSPQGKELVGYYDEATMMAFFAHEGMHQFIDLVMPDFQKGIMEGRIPMWYSEGIADCIGNSKVRAGKLYMCVMDETIANMRIPVIQDAVKAGKHIPLKRLLTMDRNNFMGNASLCYAESWSLCHFLMTYPKDEDPSKQIPKGKLKEMIGRLHLALADGKTRDQAYQEAWQLDGKPVTVDELEELWKKYVMTLPNPLRDAPFLGVQPSQTAGSDGVLLDGVVEKSPAERGGLKAGDVILMFNGAATPNWNALVKEIQGAKIGKVVEVEVRRGEESLTLKVKMEKRGDR